MDFHYNLDDALVHQVNANTWFLDLDTDLEGSMKRKVSEKFLAMNRESTSSTTHRRFRLLSPSLRR